MAMSTTTIDLTPSWETAARIYCQVLQNPDAGAVAKEDAQADLIRLGQYVDRMQAMRKENDDD
tara:strand:+ start:448 stop:636 length:189 start_codon:yes stop_codon:yes gene_type:complete